MKRAMVALLAVLISGCATVEPSPFTDQGDVIEQECLRAVEAAATAGAPDAAEAAFDRAIEACESMADLEGAEGLFGVDIVLNDVLGYTKARCEAKPELQGSAICVEVAG